MPFAASITFAGSFDSISTVSNSPEKSAPISLRVLAKSASVTAGKDEKMKLLDEHQKNCLLARLASCTAASVCEGSF